MMASMAGFQYTPENMQRLEKVCSGFSRKFEVEGECFVVGGTEQ